MPRRRQTRAGRLMAASDETGASAPPATAPAADEQPNSPALRRSGRRSTSPAAGTVAAAAAIAVAALAGSLYGVVSFLGFDSGMGGDNSGYGAPLSTQELLQLQSDEKLERTTLGGGDDVEDLREDEALLRIISGQGARIK